MLSLPVIDSAQQMVGSGVEWEGAEEFPQQFRRRLQPAGLEMLEGSKQRRLFHRVPCRPVPSKNKLRGQGLLNLSWVRRKAGASTFAKTTRKTQLNPRVPRSAMAENSLGAAWDYT